MPRNNLVTGIRKSCVPVKLSGAYHQITTLTTWPQRAAVRRNDKHCAAAGFPSNYRKE